MRAPYILTRITSSSFGDSSSILPVTVIVRSYLTIPCAQNLLFLFLILDSEKYFLFPFALHINSSRPDTEVGIPGDTLHLISHTRPALLLRYHPPLPYHTAQDSQPTSRFPRRIRLIPWANLLSRPPHISSKSVLSNLYFRAFPLHHLQEQKN